MAEKTCRKAKLRSKIDKEGVQKLGESVDRDKLKSVVAYLAEKVKPGKVQLFKLMYLADFTARVERGRSITGDSYENFEMGPVPQTLWQQFRQLISECAILEEVNCGFPRPRQKITQHPEYSPQMDNYETEILDRIVGQYGRMTGAQLRVLTHRTLPYRATERGDAISYGLAGYLNYQKPTQADIERVVLNNPQLLAELRVAVGVVEPA